MTTTGIGIFYDGVTSERHKVALTIADDAIEVSGPEGDLLARWRFADIYPLAGPTGVLRIGLVSATTAARLEIHDEALAAAVLARTKPVDRTGLTDRATRAKVVAYSLAAIVTLVGGAIWGVPLLADRIAPYLPTALEIRLGNAIDKQAREVLANPTSKKPFECGAGDAPRAVAARAALKKLIAPLEQTAKLPLPLHVIVARRDEINAITLPGGHIYLFNGLLIKAKSVDEVAGVLGHEIGHVAHRDGTKSVMEAAGLSLLFGMLIGDIGGGAVSVVAKEVVQNAYSRPAEAGADEFGANLMYTVGGDPQAMGAILLRISDISAVFPHFMLDHPRAQERVDALARIGKPSPTRALLTPPEWEALKNICVAG